MQPDFIGIGFRRSGTTWLHHVLAEHPEIAKPERGLHFFNRHFDRGTRWYEDALGESATGGRCVGEFSTTYAYPECDVSVAARIADAYPDVKLVCSIRHPIERCVSDYFRSRNRSELDGPFERALREHPELVTRGLYGERLTPFLDRFPASRLHVIKYDRIVAEPERVVHELYAFLGVDPTFRPSVLHTRVGSAPRPRSVRVERWIKSLQGAGKRLGAVPLVGPVLRRMRGSELGRRMRRANSRPRDDQRAEVELARRELTHVIDEDLRALMQRTGLDLTDWLSNGVSSARGTE
jgi:hypothetical protein